MLVLKNQKPKKIEFTLYLYN